MSEKRRPIRNLIYAVTHPLVTAREKPLLFIGMMAPAIYFLGVMQGWWPNILAK
tara:strand:+ start:720 stop:881 length:162 start_codon:yes stop_codon:yes gene_type:complete